tara:strand:+ start:362 stop:940 length:579 start_codon:yes stop_codon:yes gene_type:complete
MDWLTFISKIVEALAWPGAFLAVLLVIRKELPAIARSLRKLKFKDVELEFGEAAKAVASQAKDAVPPGKPNIRLAGQPKEEMALKLESIAELAPRAAILEAWLQVEAAAVDVVRKRTNTSLNSMPGPMRLRDSLVRAGVLNPKQVEVFEKLRALRNEAVHFPDAQFTRGSVADYIEAALAMATYLEGIADDS